MRYQTETGPGDIEFSDEMFIITRETAEKYLAAKVVADLVEVVIESPNEVNGRTPLVREETGHYTGTVGAHHENSLSTQQATMSTQAPDGESIQDETIYHLAWSGEIPPLKWMNFYSKVLTRFITDGGVKLTLQMEISPEKGISRQKIDEARIALRELGLNDDLQLE